MTKRTDRQSVSPRRATSRQSGDTGRVFENFVEVLLTDPRISQTKMFGSSGLKVRGKVFAMLFKERLVVKLPRQRVEALTASGMGEPFDPGHGRIMKEWVAVGPRPTDEWLSLVEEARDFVASKL